MIRIHVSKKDNFIKEIIIKGHANYEEYGKDIVCAAVSATYLCTINAILSLEEKSIKIEEERDKKIIKINEQNNTTNTLLKNMIRCLESLEKQYPKNIKLAKEEE